MTDTGASGEGRVSRRRFVAAGATTAALALAGCPYASEPDATGNTTDGTERQTGETTGTVTENGEATVTWGFDPVAVQEHGAEIRQALHDSGLSDDVTVEFVPADEDEEQRRADYGGVLSEDEPRPDLFLMEPGWVNVFAQRDQIQNLSELLSESAVSTIDEKYFDGLTAPARGYDSGDLFGVPVFANIPTMQYRVDLVEAAGYDPMEDDWATAPMTWEEWSNVTADVADSADVEFGFTTQWDIYEGTACCTFNEVLSSWGGAYFGGRDTLFGPVGDRPITVDANPVVQSLKMMRKFVYDEDFEGLERYGGGFTPTDILGWIERDARDPFANGNAVMHRNWSDSLAFTGQSPDATADAVLGEKLGTMPMPYAVPEAGAQAEGAGGTTAALGGGHATVNPDSQNLEAVVQVLEAAMKPAFQTELLSLQGWLPPRPELFDSEAARNVDVIGRYLDTLRLAGENVMPHPATPVWNDQASVIAQEANRVVAQEVSADEAMGKLKSDLAFIENEG